MSKTDSSGTYGFKRNGAGVTDPVLSDGAATYTPGISERRGGNSKFLHSGMKNADAQSGASANVDSSRTYDAFGNLTGSAGTWSGPFGYAGGFGYQEDPDHGLRLLGYRYYDSSTGRFISKDPIGDGRNWYGYCEGNSLSHLDANGLDPTPGLTKPPFPVPGTKDGDWKWIKNPRADPSNPSYDPKARPGKWVPKIPLKGTGGGQPQAHWEPGGQHWDVDDGTGNREAFEEDGRRIDKRDKHNLNRPGLRGEPKRPGTKTPSLPPGSTVALIIFLTLLPSNSTAAACSGAIHPSGKCPHCGKMTPLPRKFKKSGG